MWSIYKLTNQINNKIYIGQTCQKVEERWRDHRKFSNDSLIARAIKKYGWENFDKKVIDTALTQEEADEKERYWIEYYRCSISIYGKESGYNITIGGNGVTLVSKEEQEKILTYWLNKLSATQIGLIMKRDRHTITRVLRNNKISDEEILNRRFYKPHTIYIFNTKGDLLDIQDSLDETVKKYSKINKTQIRNVLSHKLATTHNLIFLYEEEIELLDDHLKRNQKQHKGAIKAINTITGEEFIYSSITEAQNITKIDRHTIRNRINKNIIVNNIKWEDVM